ncbi:MAG: acyl-CoA synthetase [Nitriliruptorales bacterium]
MSQGDLTIGRWIRDRGVVTPQRVAIDFQGDATTYAELDDRSERLGAALLSDGLRRGDRVASLTGNRPEHVELLFACAKAGLILSPINIRLAPAEIAYQLDDAEPAALFVHPDHDGLADAALAEAERLETRRHPLTRDGLDELAAGPRHARDATVADDDPLLLVYTSGTTGKPKGALLTHANCFWTNLSFDRTSDVTTTDVVLQVLPQFHVGGWNVQPLLAWWKGATVVLEPDFDPARALRRIEETRVTTMMGVPATYLFIAEQEGFADADLTSLRLAVVGGAPMPQALLRTWGERGVKLTQGYGLTEAAPNTLCVPPEDAERKLGYAGKPYPHVDVALRDPETGKFLDGPGKAELVVRGPNVFAGYWRDDEATREAFADGWLRTGDVAERDDEGFYRIRDRVKDMFISGGENVYPAEVESVLHEHPAVVEAAVIGVPHERWGEVGVAYVAARAGTTVTPDELLDLCRERLARYKVPMEMRFIEELPRSAMNKVLKTDLRRRYEETA